MVASISPVSSASAGAAYYSRDNYYARESGDGDPSAWFGKGAKSLSLSGPVDATTFDAALRGQTPDGQIVGGRKPDTDAESNVQRVHRPGIDITFSPPKDVSLLLYLGGDQRILDAHRKSVNATLKWMERNLAAARIRSGPGPAQPIKTGNLVIAKFEHDISRERDPQLHTHSVIANMTQTEDGKWRALHNDPLFRHAKLAGLAYDAEMREQLRKLGYVIKLENGRTGAYSVVGVPDDAKTEFSRGHQRIENAAATLDHNTPKTRKAVSLATRPPKTQLTADERRAEWDDRGSPWKDALERVVEGARERALEGRLEATLSNNEIRGSAAVLRGLTARLFRPSRSLTNSVDDPYAASSIRSERHLAARSAVSFGLRHTEEREAAFSLHHVRRAALEHGEDGLTLKDIDRELRLLRQNRSVRVNANDPEAEATTKRSLIHEERTRNLISGAGKSAPLIDESALASQLANSQLTNGQKTAIKAILSGTDRLVGVQGYAGTGKTTMMRATQDLANDLIGPSSKRGLSLQGLAPTHAAARQLSESGGFEAQTVARFLTDIRQGNAPKDLSNKIVLVDESSFLSTKSMNAVLEAVLKRNPARLVLSGDRRQHGAVEAGRPFDLAQRQGMTTAVMKDVVRLPKDDTHRNQRAAVLAAAEGRVAVAMKRLEANMVERPDDLAGGAVAAWSQLPKDRREDAMIVAPGHRLRGAINNEIRATKLEEGMLGKDAVTIRTMVAKDLTKAEALSARSYEAGDALLFHGRVDSLNVRAGGSRKIVAIDEPRGRVTLENSRGGQQTVSLKSLVGRDPRFSVMTDRELELRRGDRAIFTRSDAKAGIAALDSAKITNTTADAITLTHQGETKTFAIDDPALKSLTHAYAITSHASQGKTARDVIAVIDSSERKLTSQAAFYVGISRSADTLSLIVDDKDRTADALYRNSGMKTSSLEANARMDALTDLDKDPVGQSAAEPEQQAERDADLPNQNAERPEPEAGSEISL